MKTSSRSSSRATAAALRRILVPIDFSDASSQALRFAVPLARQFGGRIDLVHVVEWLRRGRKEPELSKAASDVTASFQSQLEQLAAREIPDAQRGQVAVLAEGANWGVVKIAKRRRAGLIVVATHGRGGLQRLLLGSTAEWMVRHAPCPVLTVHSAGTEASPGRKSRGLAGHIDRILVPVDFSPRTEFTVEFAGVLARILSARLGLLHVVEPLPWNFARFRDEIQAHDRKVEAEATRALEKLAASLPDDVKADVILRRAPPKQGIVEAAREWKSDLVLLPTRGTDELRHYLLGGTAEIVVRQAHCPVLTFGLDFKL